MATGRPKKFKSQQELNDCIDKYKAYLEESGKPPTIAGLAYYTGIDRQTLYNYKKDEEFFGTIKSFVDWILMNYEELAIDKGNGGIVFLLKNYGYTDRQEVGVTGKDGNELSIKITKA